MRVTITGRDGLRTEGTVALKDESFVMVKVRNGVVRVFHWDNIKDLKKVVRGVGRSINIEVFRKIRE